MVQACNFRITTTVDGQENTVLRSGQIEEVEDGFLLFYSEESANVTIRLGKGFAVIDRQGDYSLHILLKLGKTQEGLLGLGGSQGKVLVQTHHLKYGLEGRSFKLSVGYDLLFGEEKQKMRLHLRAQIR